ncbi:hypothetical protein [Mesorhizobium sp. B2-2-3]|nr:hypothetical protein [Mesorhizobium sp. B2-2-3]
MAFPILAFSAAWPVFGLRRKLKLITVIKASVITNQKSESGKDRFGQRA